VRSLSSANGEARLQLGFGEVRHRRLRPVEHRFTHPALFLRLRVDAIDATRTGEGWPWLGVERAGLVGFRARDHGDGRTPLLPWIDEILSNHGLPADGPIWLHCLPRVLGYAFKPVSFWHCHRSDGALIAVLAEVNNTFGERHFYLLDHGGRPLPDGAPLSAPKRFHVSPFLDRRGRYRFRFASRGERWLARVELEDDAGDALLVTSLSGTLQPATGAAARHALLRYGWASAMVAARIRWHALRLWLKRAPVYSKPEPLRPAVTRAAVSGARR
jgi:uncharacterized protein